MKTAFATSIALVLSVGLSSSLLADDSWTSLQSALNVHCVKCHGKDGKIEGEINLLELKSYDQLQARPELLENLITVLKDRLMPPEDEPPVPAVNREQMIAQLEAMLEQALKTQAFSPTPNFADHRTGSHIPTRDRFACSGCVLFLDERCAIRG